MIKLKIINKNNYLYEFEDENKQNYSINLEILDIQEKPAIGDYIYINKELLDPKYKGYNISYTFGNFDNKYGKENISVNDIDVIKVVKGELEIYLKRLYG